MLAGSDREAFLEMERMEKQKYLQKEIMEPGYDADWFAQIMLEKRGRLFFTIRKWYRRRRLGVRGSQKGRSWIQGDGWCLQRELPCVAASGSHHQLRAWLSSQRRNVLNGLSTRPDLRPRCNFLLLSSCHRRIPLTSTHSTRTSGPPLAPKEPMLEKWDFFSQKKNQKLKSIEPEGP